ncbi:hypothetical protein BKZ52_004631 [Escherichia coli]|nr:hypothetical protein [Escherichia coli]EHX3958851.1 hypothetical protein [Escherichia coli]
MNHKNTGIELQLLDGFRKHNDRNKKTEKESPSNESEKTELQPNDRHKKTRLVIGLFCVFQS